MYLAFALVPEKVAFRRGRELAQALRAAVAELDLAEAGDDVQVHFPGAVFTVHPEDGPHVLEESANLAGQPKIRTKKSLADEVRACPKRIEVSGDDDPEMDHFNEYLAVLQALEKALPGVVLIDPREGEVI
jgi:hypothetical protein